MCGGKGGTSTQSQSSSVQIPQEVLNRYRDINTQAQQVASQPFVSYPGQMVAPVNSTQSGAIENITNAAGIQNQWVDPAYQSLSGGLNNAAQAYGAAPGAAQPYNQTAGGLIAGSIGSASPISGQQIGQYMSPYTQSVVNATTGWMNQQNAQQQNDLRTQAIQNGAFGGDRSQVASGVLSGQQNLANASTISGLYNQNYAQALAAAQQQQGVQVGAQQQGAQLAAGLGNQVFNQGLASGQAWQGLGTAGAGAYAGLGTQQLQNVLGQSQAQLAGGTLYQQTQQAQDQAYYNQFLQQQAYPFQTTQFQANIAEGTGPLYGSTTTGYGSSTAPQPFFSDDKLKENVRTIGHTKDGLKIIRYNHKDDPEKLLRIGFLASDVEKKMPEVVSKHAGLRAVDYDRAARSHGGLVANDNWREGFAQGGGGGGGYDPQAMAAIIAAHQAMYPGAAGRSGLDGSGPRGMQLQPSGSHQVIKPEQMKLAPEKPKEPELRTAARDVNEMTNAGKGISGLYSEGKDALVGSAGKGAAGSAGYVAPSGGLIGTGGKYDWDQGWLGRNTAGLTGSGSGSTPIAAPTPADLTDSGGWNFAAGGRLRRAGGGGLASSMPYDSGGGGGYIPEALYQPADPQTLNAQRNPMSSPSSQSGGGGGLGTLASLASLGKSAASGINGLSGLLGGAEGADALPLSGLGAMTGDAAAGAAAASGGVDIATMLPLLALRRGGRAGFQDGGDPTLDEVPVEMAEAPVPAAGVVPPAAPEPRSRFRRASEYATTPEAAEVQKEAREEPPTTAGVVPETKPEAVPKAEPPKAAGVAPAPGSPQQAPSRTGPDDYDSVAARHWQQESGDRQFYPAGHPKAGQPVTSSVGAIGRSQLYDVGPEAARLAGVEWSPERAKNDEGYNKLLGDTWLKHLNEQFGDPYKATAAYNAGSEATRRAVQMAAVRGNQWWQNLPDETKNHLWVVSNHQLGSPSGSGGGPSSTAVALNAPADAAAGLAGPAVGTAQGVAPPQPDWLDRNEKYIVPALSFLGNMLSSPSRTFAGALGSGMVGAAQALPSQTKIGQEQQRIEIARNSQYMNQWAQLRQIYNTQIANNGRADPQIVAQMNHVGSLVGIAAADGTTPAPAAPAGGQNSPAGGGASPVSGGTPAPGAAPAPGAIGTQPLPPPGAAPTPTPVQPGQPGGVPPSMRAPTVDFPPEFLSQLAPTANPIEMRRRAGEMTDPGQAAQLRQRADQLQSDILRNSGGQGNSGFVPLPSAGAYKQSQERIADNLRWQTEQTPVAQARQVMRNNIEQIAKTVETFEPGEFAQFKADIQASLAGANVKPHSTATMNAEQYQTFMKNAANVILGAPTNDAKTDAAREIMRTGFADPHLQPGAVKHILAQSLGNLDYADKYFNDVTEKMNQAPHLNRAMRLKELEGEGNTPERHQAEHEKNIAVRGGTPDSARELEPGQAYIVEPTQAKAWGLPGITKPMKLRFKGVDPDGRVRFGRIQ